MIVGWSRGATLQLRPPDLAPENDEVLAGLLDELGETGTHSLDPPEPSPEGLS